MTDYLDFFQIVCLAMTTNERMNLSRYTHFHSSNEGKKGFNSPFDRGMWQNLVDFAQFRCFGYLRPARNDWTNQYEIPKIGNFHFQTTGEDRCCNSDREPLLSVWLPMLLLVFDCKHCICSHSFILIVVWSRKILDKL